MLLGTWKVGIGTLLMRKRELFPVRPVQQLCNVRLKQGKTGNLPRVHYEDIVLCDFCGVLLVLMASAIVPEYLLCPTTKKISVYSPSIMLGRNDDESIKTKTVIKTN